MVNPRDEQSKSSDNDKPLRFSEALVQAFSLIFAVQNRSGRKRLMDLAETNPMPVVLSGVISMVMFFSFCFITSQFFIHLLTK